MVSPRRPLSPRLGPLALGLLLALPAALPSRAGDADRARLERGEVLISTSKLGDGGVVAEARGVINAPPAEVWKLIDACNDYHRTMPRIAASKELSRKGDVVVCEVEAELPFPLPNLTSVTRAQHTFKDGTFRRQWSLLRGDYKHNAGHWLLTPFGDGGARTLAEYRLELELDMPVPDSILEGAQSRTLPTLFERLRANSKAAK